jgi:hypothetical protein
MPATTFAAADLAIPDAWRAAEAGMQRMGTRELVEHLWDAREHRGAAAADGAFRIAIRNALARAAADVTATPGTPTTCH